jgi:hypothetical protein
VRAVLAIAGLLLVTVLSAGAAAGADGDRRLTTRTQAVRSLPGRFANIKTVACRPDAKSASAVRGGVRSWQRFWCTGRTFGQASFRLRFETTGTCSACWKITHLSGVRAADLRARAAAATTPAPVTPEPSADYPGLGAGHWVSDVSGDASVVRLEDGSLWLVSPASRGATAAWPGLAHITVRAGTDPSYGYRLLNTDDGKTADARFLRFD